MEYLEGFSQGEREREDLFLYVEVVGLIDGWNYGSLFRERKHRGERDWGEQPLSSRAFCESVDAFVGTAEVLASDVIF